MAKRELHAQAASTPVFASKISKDSTLPKNAFEHAILGWYAQQYMSFDRGWLWFLIAGLIDLGLLLYAFYTGSWTMAVIFILLPLVYALEHRNKPKTVEVVFSPYGVKFGILRFPYSSIRKFWILHDPPFVDELHLLTNNRLHPEVIIPLMGVDPVLLREFLITQVPEWEGKQASFLDTFVRFLRLT